MSHLKDLTNDLSSSQQLNNPSKRSTAPRGVSSRIKKNEVSIASQEMHPAPSVNPALTKLPVRRNETSSVLGVRKRAETKSIVVDSTSQPTPAAETSNSSSSTSTRGKQPSRRVRLAEPVAVEPPEVPEGAKHTAKIKSSDGPKYQTRERPFTRSKIVQSQRTSMKETFVAATSQAPEEIDVSSSMAAAKKSIEEERDQQSEELSPSSSSKTAQVDDTVDIELSKALAEIEIEEECPSEPEITSRRPRRTATVVATEAQPEKITTTRSRRHIVPAKDQSEVIQSTRGPRRARVSRVPTEVPIDEK